MDNLCHFSPDRRHRYSLIHRWDPLFGDRLILWIGLNPSTADESQLDPTLTRIRTFSQREGFDGFWMANLFGLRTPYPKEMMSAPDPVGPGNDASLLAAADRCEKIVAAWGVSGVYQERADAVVRLFAGRELWCLGTTRDGHPRHPLYVAGKQPLVRWHPATSVSLTPTRAAPPAVPLAVPPATPAAPTPPPRAPAAASSSSSSARSSSPAAPARRRPGRPRKNS